MNYCKTCLYPSKTVNLNFHKSEMCSACLAHEKYNKISAKEWSVRKKKFINILKESKKNNKSEYDCIIPVSGGKDSYYQTHVIVNELGLKPLLVTYHGNNYLPEADIN